MLIATIAKFLLLGLGVVLIFFLPNRIGSEDERLSRFVGVTLIIVVLLSFLGLF